MESEMAINVSQNKHAPVSDGTALTTRSVTLDSPVAVGDFIDVWVTWANGSLESPSGCADDLGGGSPNTYIERTGARFFDSGGQVTTRFTCQVTQAGTPTITVTFAGARAYRGMQATVVSEAASVDTGAISGQYQPGTTSPATGDVSPDTAGSLVLSTTFGSALGSNTITLEGGATSVINNGGTDAFASQYKVHPTATAVNSTFTYGFSDNGHTAAITYRPSAGGDPTLAPPAIASGATLYPPSVSGGVVDVTPKIRCWERNAGVGSSLSVNKPSSGSANGDDPVDAAVGMKLVILVTNDDNTATAQWDNSTLKPTGFELINEVGNSTQDCHAAAFWRDVDGTEGSSFSIPAQSSDDMVAWCFLISGAKPGPPDFIGADAVDSTPTPFAITEVTTTVAMCLALALAAYDGGQDGGFTWGGTGWSVGDTHRTGTATTNGSGTWARKSVTSAGGSVAATVTPSTSDGMVGFQFALAPASPVPVVTPSSGLGGGFATMAGGLR